MTDRGGTLTGDEARRRLHELTLRDAALSDRIEQVLELGVEYLGVESGHVAEIDLETGHWEAIVSTDPPDGPVPEGDTRDLASSYCRHVVVQEHPLAVHDVSEYGLEDDPAYEQTEFGCYHGAAISVDGEIYGTICFASKDARATPFTDEEKLFVDLAGTLLGHAIQRARHERRLDAKHAELRQRREQFRSLLDANFDVVLRLDRDGRITSLSESDREVLGYRSQELIGTNYSELMASRASIERVTSAIDRVLDGESVEASSLDVLSCDGTTVLTDIRAAPIYETGTAESSGASKVPGVDSESDGDGNASRTLLPETADSSDADGPTGTGDMTAFDSEPREDADEEGRSIVGIHVVLRDATQRQRYEHLVSVLQRVLRHNVRNTLNVIYGSADEMAERADGDPEALETIQQTCSELLALSEKAGRLESAVGEPDTPVTVSLATVAQRVAEYVGERYPEASISVTAEEPVHARGTYGLEQAVEEIVENAAKHGGDSPTVTVTVEERDSDTVVVEVADDGPGLPEQERGVLTSGEETPLEHGSGLGHWFVYWIVTSLDGTVDARSSPSGTVVTLTLPAASSEDPSDALLDSA